MMLLLGAWTNLAQAPSNELATLGAVWFLVQIHPPESNQTWCTPSILDLVKTWLLAVLFGWPV